MLQEELFTTQLAGLEEEDSMAKMDHGFRASACVIGMRRPAGLGVRIDRLVMVPHQS